MDERLDLAKTGGIEIQCTGKPVRVGKSNPYAEIIFIVDTTGSMNNVIDGLMKTCQRFASALSSMQVDCHLGILCFGDLTIQPPDKMFAFPLTTDMHRIELAFQEILQKYRSRGGSNIGESSIDALFKAMDLYGQGQPSAQVFLLFSDEPPIEPDMSQRTMQKAINDCSQRGITCFTITIPDKRYKMLASKTGGEWFQISAGTDFLGILDKLFPRVANHIESSVLKLSSGKAGRELPGKKAG